MEFNHGSSRIFRKKVPSIVPAGLSVMIGLTMNRNRSVRINTLIFSLSSTFNGNFQIKISNCCDYCLDGFAQIMVHLNLHSRVVRNEVSAILGFKDNLDFVCLV